MTNSHTVGSRNEIKFSHLEIECLRTEPFLQPEYNLPLWNFSSHMETAFGFFGFW